MPFLGCRKGHHHCQATLATGNNEPLVVAKTRQQRVLHERPADAAFSTFDNCILSGVTEPGTQSPKVLKADIGRSLAGSPGMALLNSLPCIT